MPYLLTILLVVILYRLAKRAPASVVISRRPDPRRPVWFFVAGFVGSMLLFALGWGLPGSTVPPLVTVILMGCLVLAFGWVVFEPGRRPGAA